MLRVRLLPAAGILFGYASDDTGANGLNVQTLTDPVEWMSLSGTRRTERGGSPVNSDMRLRVARMLCVSLGACMLLVACHPRIGGNWHLTIDNYSEEEGFPSVVPCRGELAASVTVADLVSLRAVAEADHSKIASTTHAGKVRRGDRAVLETTCTEENGTEIGYARVDGRVTAPPYGGYGGATFVYPPNANGSLSEWCLTPTEQRGMPPCIVERMVIPD